MRNTPLGVLGSHKVICANNKATLRVVDAGVLLGVNQSLPLVLFEPSLLRVYSLSYLVLAFREYSSHVVANVARARHEIHVQGEKGLSFHEIFNAVE